MGDTRLLLRYRVDGEEGARAHEGHEGPRGRLRSLDAIRKRGVRVAKDREVLTVVSYETFERMFSGGVQVRYELVVKSLVARSGPLRDLPGKHANRM